MGGKRKGALFWAAYLAALGARLLPKGITSVALVLVEQ